MIEALHYAVLFFAWIPGINLLLQARDTSSEHIISGLAIYFLAVLLPKNKIQSYSITTLTLVF